ncbi:hypothetical protein EVAR_67430_1 [Eumeta japonica]|uniref:Uncharacterized protein n=1 Tax=Eumeta variegata TaxID=151549 RepID=A0A4C1SF62_EUMVA|nr:hypothetical protein EVAR_67430_1 [Eumeta japonica]
MEFGPRPPPAAPAPPGSDATRRGSENESEFGERNRLLFSIDSQSPEKEHRLRQLHSNIGITGFNEIEVERAGGRIGRKEPSYCGLVKEVDKNCRFDRHLFVPWLNRFMYVMNQ